MKRSLLLLFLLLILWPQAARAQCPVGGGWTNPTTPPPIAEWSTVAYGNGRYVALATSGAARVSWSTDGMTWNAPATTIPTSSWRWVTFANGMFIAVGYDGTRRIMTSTNGSNWTLVNNATANGGSWQSVTYGKGLYVAIANVGTNRVATSSNGTTWTARAVPSANWSTVYYANGRFIALPFSGTTAMYSDNGINWTTTSIPNGGWMDVVYGGGQFVAVSWTGTHIATSPDGITWTGRSVPDSRNWNGIEYVGGHYVVVGGGGSGPNRTMISSNGITWVAQPIVHGGQTLGDIIWGGDKLVVIGGDMYTGAIQFFVGACPYQCYMPNALLGAREYFEAQDTYKFCSGRQGWQPFSLDGEGGGCAVSGEMDWHDGQSVHTMCDGTTRHPLRYSEQSCSLTDDMMGIGGSITNPAWVSEATPIALYDNGTKAVVGARWNTGQLRFDFSASPAAPTVIGTPTTAANRVDISSLVIRNNHVFSVSPGRNGAGRIFASPLSNMATSYSFPSGSALSGNRMCDALGLAMNDDGSRAFVTAWSSGAASCPSAYLGGSCLLNVFNTSNPASMSEVTTVNLSTMATNGNVYCNEAYFRSGRLFVSFASGPGDGGLMVLDVSNPASPTLLGQRWVAGIGNTQFDYFDVSEDGTLAVLVSRAGRVVSMDVSNPANPTVLDSALVVPVTGGASDVVIVKNYAFVAGGPNRIYAINLTDPSDLKLDATITDNMFSDIGEMVLAGEYIYYTSTGSGRVGILELNCDVENSGPPNLGMCSKTAEIEFEANSPLYKYCDGSNWRPMTGDPCAFGNDTPPGTVCYDGSIYVGESPDGGWPMYTTPQDSPLGGSRWNVLADTLWQNASATDMNSGSFNTRVLAAANLAQNTSAHPLAGYCDSLVAHGHKDWYMPSINEMAVVYRQRAVIGGFPAPTGSSPWYWTSTAPVDPWFNAYWHDFYGSGDVGYSGWQAGGNWPDEGRVRCVRKNSPPDLNDPCDPGASPALGTFCRDGTHYAGTHPTIAGARLYVATVGQGWIPRWSNENVVTGATSFVDGRWNQDRIITTRNINNYPAMLACHNLRAGGHSDWYLPSIAELDTLYSNLMIAPGADSDNPLAPTAPSGLGGNSPSGHNGPMIRSFPRKWYWSSTEGNASNAYDANLNSGYRDLYGNKMDSSGYNENEVRCVRRVGS